MGLYKVHSKCYLIISSSSNDGGSNSSSSGGGGRLWFIPATGRICNKTDLKDYYGMLEHIQKGQWKGRWEGGKERERKGRQVNAALFVSPGDWIIWFSEKYTVLYISRRTDPLLERERFIPATPTQALYPAHMGSLQRSYNFGHLASFRE